MCEASGAECIDPAMRETWLGMAAYWCALARDAEGEPIIGWLLGRANHSR